MRNLRDRLIAEIRELDPTFRFQIADQGGMPTTIPGRNAMLSALRGRRAAEIYRRRGDLAPLQLETLRFIQSRVDESYANARRLYQTRRLNARLGQNEAIGNYIDFAVRRSLREYYNSLEISVGRSDLIQVNRRAYHTSEATYRVPDVRVGDVIFDVTLTRKAPGSAQIVGFFNSQVQPTAVIIVRPRQMGQHSTYAIASPRGGQ